MPKLPDSVTVGPYRIKIVPMGARESVDKTAHGVFEADHLEIFVSTASTIERTRNTLLHEILHAIWYVKQPNIVGLNPPDAEELIVIAMTNELQRVMADNPAVRKFLWP